MITITVNGQVETINIGCRTFVSLTELTQLLSLTFNGSQLRVNGETISQTEYPQKNISSGDNIEYQTKAVKPGAA